MFIYVWIYLKLISYKHGLWKTKNISWIFNVHHLPPFFAGFTLQESSHFYFFDYLVMEILAFTWIEIFSMSIIISPIIPVLH